MVFFEETYIFHRLNCKDNIYEWINYYNLLNSYKLIRKPHLISEVEWVG